MIRAILSLADLRPGDVGFGPIDGVPGVIAKVGQWMLGERVRLRRVSVDHVFMITDVIEGSVFAVEAMPGGAREVCIDDRWTDRHAFVRPGYVSTGQAAVVASVARDLIGTPYSFLDYVALGARQRHLGEWMPDRLEARVRRRVADSGRMICSQLVDQAMTLGGFSVFDDGRLSQDVTPGELFYQLIYHRGGSLSVPFS